MAAAYHPVGGLETLEMGLSNLRRSRLMVIPEFQTMFGAIERHHRDLKLAHLTGKAKDLQDQAIRDTKFYNILVKMLCEVKEKRTGEQREGLRRVHTWFMANKHVLFCGPRFGKEQLKEEGQEVLRKATTPREAKRAKSARERPLSSRVKVTSSRSVHQQKSGGQRRLHNSIQSTPRIGLQNARQPQFKLNFVYQDGDDANNPVWNTPEIDEMDYNLQLATNIEDSLINYRDENNADPSADEGPVGNSASPSPTRVLSRPKTASSVKFSPLREQSGNRPVTPFTKKPVHSIASMVNPHAELAKELSPLDPDDVVVAKSPRVARAMSAMPTRSENLQAWNTFSKNRSYGQDLMGKLSFVGRSGTTSDVRYTAHSQGENPEAITMEAVNHYAQTLSPGMPPPTLQLPNEDDSPYMNQTLEEFYKTADTIKPSPRTRPSYARVNSAPTHGQRSQKGQLGPQQPLSFRLGKVTTPKGDQQTDESEKTVVEEEVPPLPPQASTGVRLDTVINVIDSVTDDMAYFRERLAPDPEPGFRQPTTSTEPTPRPISSMDDHDAAARTFPTPEPHVTHEDQETRPMSNPFSSHIAVVKEDGVEGRKGKVRCKSAGTVQDWRGRIQPETMRYKWSKTKFGGHTYLKKWYRPNLRSAGSASGGKRPKTAPNTRERWKTEKESDKNKRVVQAASHVTTQVDQDDVDHMITVQHLLSGEDRTDSLDSLFGMDEAFWKNFRKGSPTHRPTSPPSMEFLSFITPSASVIAEQKAQLAASHLAQGDDEDVGDHKEPAVRHAEIRVPQPTEYDEEALIAAVKEEEELRTQRSEAEVHQEEEGVSHPQAPPTSQVNQSGTHSEVASVVLPEGRSPTPSRLRQNPLQELSQSEQWQFSTEVAFFGGEKQPDLEETRKSDPFGDVNLPTDHSIPANTMTTRVERSAGRMPSRTHSTSAQMLAFSRRYTEALKRAPPLRTPPSIPNSQASNVKPRKSSQYALELEYHARRTRSPLGYLKKVEDLRSIDSSRPTSKATTVSIDPIVGNALQVCRLPTASRGGRSSRVSSDYEFDFSNPYAHSGHASLAFMSREQSSLHAIDESRDLFLGDKQVSFSDLQHVSTSGTFPSKPMTAPTMPNTRQTLDYPPDEFMLQRNATFTSIGSRQTGGRPGTTADGQQILQPPPSRNIARIGRPIAQVSQVPDPDELFEAVKVQKEAAAAVDIQRIFRGFVARNQYKYLLSEERNKREEERRAAIKIQSMFRGHVTRKNEIYNRPPLDPELIKWAKDFKAIQMQKAAERQVKISKLSNEISSNHKEANTKLATIGPHVEIYDIYHPKKVGPTKRELNMAAVTLQKVVRGWMIRRKMEKLARKAAWYGSSFTKMVKEYKNMLRQVQHQHGVDKAKAPFSIKEMNDYIDVRRRYESVFEKKSFGGELEMGDVEAFFRECDLYPSQLEIEEAMDVTMRGQKKESQSLKKKELMDIIFYIYVPRATGLSDTRQSTWMSPIINGQEAKKLLGSEYVEPAPLAPCAKLVIDAKRDQRQKEQAAKETEQRKRIKEANLKKEEERKDEKKNKKVTLQSPLQSPSETDSK